MRQRPKIALERDRSAQVPSIRLITRGSDVTGTYNVGNKEEPLIDELQVRALLLKIMINLDASGISDFRVCARKIRDADERSNEILLWGTRDSNDAVWRNVYFIG